mmetsp:Transcript_46052/g.148008  ORF Transcript_46052/g.148008 Transcript_46052/m.148008 type:complete len:147 (+) Transcript_46052:96-536(+)|eukprot:CAMPEP_0204112664 /NCGR_PEP_ID=MMETSP0361-20130328/3199_1 /ASSEMBLY_ACC=CAM_ASM_000343 /TAXON_ID=268821 /ORGANISM="Scrippsiella Hangoei, Strain SHTV-5" /LENGTH=146 /DNA_ID=CAMNT_0051062917 /DNA_START=58 /DNA_END=498 /DNA_ORIENTATION=+
MITSEAAELERRRRLSEWLDCARCRLPHGEYDVFVQILRDVLAAAQAGTFSEQHLQSIAAVLRHAHFPEGDQRRSEWMQGFCDSLPAGCRQLWCSLARDERLGGGELTAQAADAAATHSSGPAEGRARSPARGPTASASSTRPREP